MPSDGNDFTFSVVFQVKKCIVDNCIIRYYLTDYNYFPKIYKFTNLYYMDCVYSCFRWNKGNIWKIKVAWLLNIDAYHSSWQSALSEWTSKIVHKIISEKKTLNFIRVMQYYSFIEEMSEKLFF